MMARVRSENQPSSEREKVVVAATASSMAGNAAMIENKSTMRTCRRAPASLARHARHADALPCDDGDHGGDEHDVEEQRRQHDVVARRDRRQARENEIGRKRRDERQAHDHEAGPELAVREVEEWRHGPLKTPVRRGPGSFAGHEHPFRAWALMCNDPFRRCGSQSSAGLESHVDPEMG